MGDRLGSRPVLLWATLALMAAGGLFTGRRAIGPATGRYRLERIDRGLIRNEVMAPGTVTAVTTDLSRIQVQATVSEADVGRVAVGEAAILHGRGCPDCVSTGTVSDVRPNPPGSAGAGDYTVLVEADNHDHKLRLGMAATVCIEVARRIGVLRLPVDALCFVPPGVKPATPSDPHAGRVFVLDHGRPRPVRVTVGLEDRRHGELVAGPFREGDAVIVSQEW